MRAGKLELTIPNVALGSLQTKPHLTDRNSKIVHRKSNFHPLPEVRPNNPQRCLRFAPTKFSSIERNVKFAQN